MSIRLKVDEAKKSDIGRQIARIPSSIADQLQLKTGDPIEIKGGKITYAKVWRSSSSLVRPHTIMIESLIRQNADTSLDEYVSIATTSVKPAKEITLQLIDNVDFQIELTEYVSRFLVDRLITDGDAITINTGFGGTLYLRVEKSIPDGPIIVMKKTKISINHKGTASRDPDTDQEFEIDKTRISKISYEDIGGLSNAIMKIREMIELPLRYPEIFVKLGIQPPKGVLMYGPPGTGKTQLARAIASETSSYFITVSGPEMISKYYGESENKLREIFEDARSNSPAIIFIDEIDSIVPKRDNSTAEVEKRIVAQLLSLMDGLEDRGNIVVIGATNRPNALDDALRRGGRFDREIEIGIPDLNSRKEIIEIHTRGMPLHEDVNLDRIANTTHGFVGADLQTLAKEAALSSLHRFIPNFDFSKEKSLSTETLDNLEVRMEDFIQALREVSPSALREVFIEFPNITWQSIGGLEDIKQELQEAVEWPMKFPKLFSLLDVNPPKGILLYGPPGTGKTMLAKALANETSANFISIKGPELLSKWIGDSEKGVREIFRKARAASPCIIFFDEIDSITISRNKETDTVITRIISQLLTEMDGLEELRGVTVLAATNRPDIMDAALLRPGRFDRIIHVGYPDLTSRKSIFHTYLSKIKVSENVSINEMAKKSQGYSGAEIKQIITMAKMMVIREYISNHKDSDESYLDKLELQYQNLIDSFDQVQPQDKRTYNLKPPSISDIGYV